MLFWNMSELCYSGICLNSSQSCLVMQVPATGFQCTGRVEGGYYADPAAECQVSIIDGLESDILHTAAIRIE
jgi:hypothetical protein